MPNDVSPKPLMSYSTASWQGIISDIDADGMLANSGGPWFEFDGDYEETGPTSAQCVESLNKCGVIWENNGPFEPCPCSLEAAGYDPEADDHDILIFGGEYGPVFYQGNISDTTENEFDELIGVDFVAIDGMSTNTIVISNGGSSISW